MRPNVNAIVYLPPNKCNKIKYARKCCFSAMWIKIKAKFLLETSFWKWNNVKSAFLYGEKTSKVGFKGKFCFEKSILFLGMGSRSGRLETSTTSQSIKMDSFSQRHSRYERKWNVSTDFKHVDSCLSILSIKRYEFWTFEFSSST